MAVAAADKVVRGNDLAYVSTKFKDKFVAKENGKGLSTNDYTTAEKNKLAGIAAGVQPATVAPLMDGTAAVGSSAKFAREDHVHPSDTSKANVANPSFTGAVSISNLGKSITIHTDGLIEMEDGSSSPAQAYEVTLPQGSIGDVLATENYVTTAIANKANKATTLAGYGITDAYTKTQTDAAISSAVSDAMIGGFVVSPSLPTASASTMGKIYLIPNSGTGTNIKDEYITIRSGNEGAYTYSWELLGTTQIDLTNYVTHDEFDPRLTTAEIDLLLAL